MNSVLLGMVLGLLAAGGLLLAVLNSPLVRRVTLDDRLAPYLRDAPRPSRLLEVAPAVTPFQTLERILAPVLSDATQFLERHVGGGAGVRRKLERVGRGQSVQQFRTEQVIWASLGLGAALVVVLFLAVSGGGLNPVSGLMLPLAGLVGGIAARDHWLGKQVARRERSMIAEFPTVAELLALAVAAGEGPVAALERITRLSAGELPRELRMALDQARSGVPLTQALQGIADRTGLDQLARFVDGMIIAIERGTPLADVLRAQAVDVRESGKRALLEAGGKKEIAMMVPVVFLVLPITVVFALFPGLVSITSLAT